MTTTAPPDSGGTWDRRELQGGLSFIERAASPTWGIGGLRAWFEEHLVSAGHMATPVTVQEPQVGTVVLYARGAGARMQASLPALLGVARQNVLSALRGFLAIPSNDRFVTAALFSGRVRRASSAPLSRDAWPHAPAASRWVPRPDPNGPLSAVALSLFVVDVLTHRETYERNLCICDACGKITFQDGPELRRACALHAPTPSGFMRRVAEPPAPDSSPELARLGKRG